MASATMTAWDKALKQYYRAEEVAKVVYDSHPFLELVPKDTGFKGKNCSDFRRGRGRFTG